MGEKEPSVRGEPEESAERNGVPTRKRSRRGRIFAAAKASAKVVGSRIKGGARHTGSLVVTATMFAVVGFVVRGWLDRPVLVIEEVEVVPTQRTISLDATLVRPLIEHDEYIAHSTRDARLARVVLGRISATDADHVEETMEAISEEIRDKIETELAVRQNLRGETDGAVIRAAARDYFGRLYNSLAFTGDRPDSMKAAFFQHIEDKLERLRDRLETAQKIRTAIERTVPKIAYDVKVTVCNDGNTDGLIRRGGMMAFSETGAFPLTMIRAPQQNPFTGLAVPVAVANPAQGSTERSEGTVRADAGPVEIWFVIDEEALSDTQVEMLETIILFLQRSLFSITLRDQDGNAVRFSAAPYRAEKEA